MGPYVTPLDQDHDVVNFDCGTPALNSWLHTMARQHKNKKLSQTFILADEEAPQTIMGFYALAVRGLTARTSLPSAMARKLPQSIPGYTLARLAVSECFKKQGHGEFLLFHAIARAQEVSSQAGGPFLFVDAKDDAAAAFYAKYGFVPLPDDSLTLVLHL